MSVDYEKALYRACTELYNNDLCVVKCTLDWKVQLCDNSGSNYDCAECWMKYFMQEV